jgi:hypothetical protein
MKMPAALLFMAGMSCEMAFESDTDVDAAMNLGLCVLLLLAVWINYMEYKKDERRRMGDPL